MCAYYLGNAVHPDSTREQSDLSELLRFPGSGVRTGGSSPGRCLCDYAPRTFDAECCNILCNFAEIVVRDAERYAAEDGVSFANPAGSSMSSTGVHARSSMAWALV